MSPNLTADQQLALAYAGSRQAQLYEALFGLEAAMAQIALTAHEPLLAQIKLAWWAEEGLKSPKGGSAIGDAVLAVQHTADHQGIVPPFVEAWKVAAYGVDDFDEAAALRADAWGSALGVNHAKPVLTAWASLDLHMMTGAKGAALDKQMLLHLRRNAKPLAVLALLASHDAALSLEHRSRPGSPARMARAFLFGAAAIIL